MRQGGKGIRGKGIQRKGHRHKDRRMGRGRALLPPALLFLRALADTLRAVEVLWEGWLEADTGEVELGQ